MKRGFNLVAIILVLMLLLVMTGCSGNDSTPKENGDKDAVIKVDEDLITVDVTLASSFFTEMTEDEIKTAAEEAGYISYTINQDGSVTYVMTKTKRKEMLESYKSGVDETINDYLNGDEKVESFKEIKYNDDLSQVDIYVDSSSYSMWDSLHALGFYMYGAFYQNFAGVSSDDIDVVVNFIDNATDETLDTGSYQNFINNSTNSVDSAYDNSVFSEDNWLELKVGETITEDNVNEFYVEYTNIDNDIIPPKPNDWYSHYEAEEGKVYVDICVSFKNLGAKEIVADEVLSGTLLYAGNYQYNGFSIIEEDNRGDFTYSNITSISPLSTEYLHYLILVPEEVQSSEGALTAIITINNKPYKITIRDGIEGEVSSLNQNAVAKSSGNVKKGEIITIAKTCEFYVDYSNITDDVIPPQPADWYSHYEAEDGKIYVDLCIAYKNWESKSVRADDVLSAKLIYADNYEYNGFSMIEESSRSDFTYSNITGIAPLITEYIHYLFEVPDEVASSGESIKIDLNIGGNSYSYNVK
jgi:hypothetical protein